MKLLVTGASGFVGKHLCQALATSEVEVVAISRRNITPSYSNISFIKKTLDSSKAWGNDWKGVDVVIHLAGRAHVMQEASKDPYKAYAAINVGVTKQLAEEAARQGVKRFVFLSSVKVNGESTISKPFTEEDKPQPEDDYGKTKYEAEEVLRVVANETNMEVVIIRPPLIYGVGVKANFKNLIKLCQMDIPLPFGAIKNKRSLVYIGNLINFIQVCIKHPHAANQTFLISDGDDISTTVLIKMIKKASNKKNCLISIPQSWLMFLLKTLRKQQLASRVLGDLQVDISKAKNLLGWKPVHTVQAGINETISGNQ